MVEKKNNFFSNFMPGLTSEAQQQTAKRQKVTIFFHRL